MMAIIGTELRKLLTIRSTYIISGFLIVLTTLFSVYVFGYKHSAGLPVDTSYITQSIYAMLSFTATFSAVVAILMVAHEYRYNMIIYTLTSVRNRLLVLAAKALVALLYATVMAWIVIVIVYFGTYLGLSLADKTIPAQQFDIVQLIPQWLVYIWGYAMFGFVIALIVRGLVGSIVVFFLWSSLEGILSLILKESAKYLPFRALDATASTSIGTMPISPNLSHNTAMLVTLGYLALFLVIAGVLFVQRDALKD